jgi:choline dehydrogenase-like flavoprotein
MMVNDGTIYGLENIEKRKEKYSLVGHDIVVDADVCIIGSGAAGAILGEKLANGGSDVVDNSRSVVILEKGGYYDAEDMNQREVDMVPLLWKNGGANFTDNLRMVIAQGQCLGGSTVINDAVCFKTPQIVREEWRKMGVDISDEQWNNSLDEVWSKIHASRVKEGDLNQNNLMLKKACAIKHYKSSENDRNCKDCMKCGFCHLGCHYETKQDMLVTYIHDMLNKPGSKAKIFCNCASEKVTYSNGIVDGVEGSFIDSTGAKKYNIRVNAKVVIISAGAIASSQLLLKNRIAEGKTGKGLSLHPAPFLLGRFKDKINAYDGIPMAYTCHEFGVTNGMSEGGFLIESIFLPIFQFSMGLPTFLEYHQKFMEDFTHYTMAGVMIRDESNGTISLTENGNPRVHYVLSQKDIKNISNGLKTLAEMWFDVGAEQVISGHRDVTLLNRKEDIQTLVQAVETNPDALQVASAHPQGGNRMGEDVENCVVDSKCKVHGFKNLYICDASVFPTSLGVNPQVTVMAIAAMTADNINKIWDEQFAGISTEAGAKLGETCSIQQPMYCSRERLEAMFNSAKNELPIEILINAVDRVPSAASIGVNSIDASSKAVSSTPPKAEEWSFNNESLLIYNNRYWKGFFPTDQDLTLIRYFGGFWKRFYKEGQVLKGTTHPFDAPLIYAPNLPQLQNYPGYGEVILLKYTSPEFALFYDLLKIIDKDTILGKAFFGSPPFGNQVLTFSMARKYHADFMTEEDHEIIYDHYARAPKDTEVAGRWTGKMVSDSALTPTVQVFTYTKDKMGKLQMQYVFGGLLRGISRVTLTPEQMNMYDITNWHDEVKIVSDDFMVGKWCSPWSEIPLDFAPSFLSTETEESKGRSRLCLRFTLKRN